MRSIWCTKIYCKICPIHTSWYIHLVSDSCTAVVEVKTHPPVPHVPAARLIIRQHLAILFKISVSLLRYVIKISLKLHAITQWLIIEMYVEDFLCRGSKIKRREWTYESMGPDINFTTVFTWFHLKSCIWTSLKTDNIKEATSWDCCTCSTLRHVINSVCSSVFLFSIFCNSLNFSTQPWSFTFFTAPSLHIIVISYLTMPWPWCNEQL